MRCKGCAPGTVALRRQRAACLPRPPSLNLEKFSDGRVRICPGSSKLAHRSLFLFWHNENRPQTGSRRQVQNRGFFLLSAKKHLCCHELWQKRRICANGAAREMNSTVHDESGDEKSKRGSRATGCKPRDGTGLQILSRCCPAASGSDRLTLPSNPRNGLAHRRPECAQSSRSP